MAPTTVAGRRGMSRPSGAAAERVKSGQARSRSRAFGSAVPSSAGSGPIRWGAVAPGMTGLEQRRHPVVGDKLID